MPRRYSSVGGTNPATQAVADHCQYNLWNPSADHTVYLVLLALVIETGSAMDVGLVRTSTTGAGQAFHNTHLSEHDWDFEVPPVLHSYHGPFATTQPVVEKPYLFRGTSPNVAGASGFSRFWVFEDEPLQIPPGSGLAVATPTGVAIPPVWITYTWEEDTQ